jgi:DNA-binding CsgD family transcriptional regulator
MDYNELSNISSCQSHGELMELIGSLLRRIGIESFVFIYFEKKIEKRNNIRHLIGCNKSWVIEYSKRKWFSIDLFSSYSRLFDRPVLISDFSIESRGQRDLMDHYHSHGFRSGMVIPSHSLSNDRVGVFIVGNDCVNLKGNIVFSKNTFLLREISLEILNWLNAYLQPKNIDVRQLSELDLKLLKFGFFDENTSNDIALLSNLTVSQVNNRFRKINRLFGVDNRKDAANIAMGLGIIQPYIA